MTTKNCYTNDEFVIKNYALANDYDECLVFNVGDSGGMWGKLLLKYIPFAKVVFFEKDYKKCIEIAKNIPGQQTVRKLVSDTLDIKENKKNIQAITIDEYCLKTETRKINFLKVHPVDTKCNIIKGALRMINGNRIDYIGWRGGLVNFRQFYKMLGLRYRIFTVTDAGLQPIESAKEYPKQTPFINFLAVLGTRHEDAEV